MYNVRTRLCDEYTNEHGRNYMYGMRCRKIHGIFDSSLRDLCSRLRDRHAHDSSNDVYGMYLW